jgi:hypothetical protein
MSALMIYATGIRGAIEILGCGFTRCQYSLAPPTRRLRPISCGLECGKRAMRSDRAVALMHHAGKAAVRAAEDSRNASLDW